MSLQFIMGPSGSGKSHYLYQKVTEESIKHPDRNYFVIVPDQFTLQTQKDLVEANPNKGILNVDVLSFNRLAYRIFDETGEGKQTVLNDVGKSLILRKLAGDYESELKVLGGNLKKTGFIGEVKSVISEFTQYDIQAERLDALMKEVGEATNFYYKLQDIKTVYEGFQTYLSDRYITGEELLDVLCRAVPKSKLLKDSVIVLDGFTGFTPVQNHLLQALLCVCDEMAVTVTVSPHRKNHPLFDLSDKMVDALTMLAEEVGVRILEPVTFYQKPVYRFRKNAPLDFLEGNLFRYTKEQYDAEQESVQIYSGKQPRDEMEFVAQSVRKFVRERGMRYREIAVIAGDMNTYANHAEKVFAEYHIPYFMDYKRSILLNSFVEYLRSLLAMAEQNFTYESVFRYLRTGLVEFTAEEVDILENYCIALGIKGYKQWNEPWIRRMQGMEESELAEVNALRVRFLESIGQVMPVLKSRSKTVEDITRALHTHFLEHELQQKVKSYETQFALAGELGLEKEYAQIYRIVMELFDQFVELLGEEKLALKEYCELLDAGLEQAKVGVIPPSVDQVVMGDIERTRIKDIKVIFFVGLNDNFIPGNANAGGLLSEQDRERFAASKIALAPGVKEKAFLQKFYLYMILTKPSEQIILTYSRAGSDGKQNRPAYLVMDLLKLFPRMQVRTMPEDIQDCELTKESGLSYLVRGLQNKSSGLSDAWQELYTWYCKHPKWCAQLAEIVEAAFYRNPKERLTREAAEALYGKMLKNSVSRMERFAMCAYAHFLSYGLRLREREVYEFRAVDTGTLLHTAMEHYARKLEQAGESWTEVSTARQEALIAECVEEAIVDYGNTILYSSARNENRILRLKKLMRRSVWALTKQLEKGDFVPRGFEVVYESAPISLEDGHEMQVRGRIDRIDICEDEDEVYVKVVDYKTGAKVLGLGEVYDGLQLQLVVYLNEAMRREAERYPGKKILPAGMFYYRMLNPLLGRAADEQAQEAMMLKALCPQGLVNASEDAIEHMEHNLQGTSTVIPAGRNADGTLSKHSSTLSEEEFALVQEYVERKMQAIGNEIMRGTIDVNPYVKGNDTGCGYCPYRSVCGFDEKLEGYGYRPLTSGDRQEILEEMRKEAETWA